MKFFYVQNWQQSKRFENEKKANVFNKALHKVYQNWLIWKI